MRVGARPRFAFTQAHHQARGLVFDQVLELLAELVQVEPRGGRDDFEDSHELAKFAATVGLNLDEFCREFQYLVEDEPPGLVVSLGEAEPGSRSNPRS